MKTAEEISLPDMIAQRGNLEFALVQIKNGNLAERYGYVTSAEDRKNYEASLALAKQVLALEYDDASVEQVITELESYIETLKETIAMHTSAE